MRRLAPYIALLLAFQLMPGARELVENAVHLVASGHAAHAVDDQDHEPQGEEHHCAGAMHVCSCHHGVSTAGAAVAVTARPLPAVVHPDWALAAPLGDAHVRDLFRPPIA